MRRGAPLPWKVSNSSQDGSSSTTHEKGLDVLAYFERPGTSNAAGVITDATSYYGANLITAVSTRSPNGPTTIVT